MAPRTPPERDHDRVELIRSFRPTGSATVVSLWDAGEGVRLPMLRWGNAIYSPVYEGMRFAVDVYNGRNRMIAIPTYIEGANLWTLGPSAPEECEPSHMWELRPGETMRVDALMNPEGQRGRPIVITQTGFGATVGEATFGTTAYRGQLRIYERMPIEAAPPAPHGTNQGEDDREEMTMACVAAMPRPAAMAPPPPPMAYGPPAHQAYAAPAPARAKEAPRGQAGFGAGEEEVREHHYTGVDYHRQAEPVVFLRIEMRGDFEEMLRQKLGSSWSWRWEATWGEGWYDAPWMWPVPPTAPHIPVTRPRRDG